MRSSLRPFAALAAALVVVLALAGPAAAHVTVNPSTATPGSYAKLTFRVPNERAESGTVKLDVQIPTDRPITSVSLQPVPGWTAEVTKVKLATPVQSGSNTVSEVVGQISWSGGTIEPGEFQEFSISVGPLPKDTAPLVFKAVQTYASGEVVRWVEQAPEGQPEPKNPAPVLKLVAATGSVTPTEDHSDGAVTPSGSSSSDSTARTLGIIGIVAGVLGLAVGVVGLRRKTAPPAA